MLLPRGEELRRQVDPYQRLLSPVTDVLLLTSDWVLSAFFFRSIVSSGLTLPNSASQGLGKQILTAFARSGAHGAVVDLTIDSANQSLSEINTELKESGMPPANLKGYECDTSSEEGVKSTWRKLLEDFQRIDVVVTNAGIIGEAPAEEYPFDEWKKLLEVNVNGTFLFAREAGKHMLEKEIKGTIIMVSSMSGVVVNRPQKQSAYNVVRIIPFTLHHLRTGAYVWRDAVKSSNDADDEIFCHRVGSTRHPRQCALTRLYSDTQKRKRGDERAVQGVDQAYSPWPYRQTRRV